MVFRKERVEKENSRLGRRFWCLKAKFSLGLFSVGEENLGGSTVEG